MSVKPIAELCYHRNSLVDVNFLLPYLCEERLDKLSHDKSTSKQVWVLSLPDPCVPFSPHDWEECTEASCSLLFSAVLSWAAAMGCIYKTVTYFSACKFCKWTKICSMWHFKEEKTEWKGRQVLLLSTCPSYEGERVHVILRDTKLTLNQACSQGTSPPKSLLIPSLLSLPSLLHAPPPQLVPAPHHLLHSFI